MKEHGAYPTERRSGKDRRTAARPEEKTIGWKEGMREAWKICQDMDDRGEWGEAADACARAIVARIEASSSPQKE